MFATIDYSAITAWIGLAAVLIAIIALFLEHRRSRLALQADLTMRLNEKFFGEEMGKIRKGAAQKLLRKNSNNSELEVLMAFFSVSSMLLERKALDYDLAFDLGEYWVVRYWHCAQDKIAAARETYPETWVKLERLIAKFEKGAEPIPDEELDRFLNEEASLD